MALSGAELRIIIDDEQKIWFVAKDIGEMLELKNIRYNLAELPKGVSTTYPLATDGDEKGTQKVSTLYTAIQSSFFLPFK